MSSPASFDPSSLRTRVCPSVSLDVALQASGSDWLPPKPFDCAAVVLEDDAGVLAVMTFFKDFARTLSILSWKCLRSLSLSDRHRVIELLLEALIAESKVRGLQSVRYLDSRQGRRGISIEEPALTKSGFRRCVSASVWKPVQSLVDARRHAVATCDDTYDICGLDFQTSLDCQVNRGQIEPARIEMLINRVSDYSEDITRLPGPNPRDLLKCWLTKPARAMIASIDQKPVGIVVWSEMLAENCIDVMIEYLGIDPDYRRHKVATTLLLKTLDQIHQHCFRMPVEVSVFVDESNRPASNFYHATGFRKSTWLIDVWLYPSTSGLESSMLFTRNDPAADLIP